MTEGKEAMFGGETDPPASWNSSILSNLPTADQIRADIARCDEEKKKLKALLKVVEGQ